jgi:hypothetical protein
MEAVRTFIRMEKQPRPSNQRPQTNQNRNLAININKTNIDTRSQNRRPTHQSAREKGKVVTSDILPTTLEEERLSK